MYEPPFDPTDKITATALDIAEMVGRLAPDSALSSSPVLHRELRIKTIHSSLAIEQNTLTMEQVTDIIDGRRVFGPPDDIREVRNAKRAYDLLGNWDPRNMDDLLEAHGVMMEGLRRSIRRGSIDPCRNPRILRSRSYGRPVRMAGFDEAPPASRFVRIPLRVRIHPPVLRRKRPHRKALAHAAAGSMALRARLAADRKHDPGAPRRVLRRIERIERDRILDRLRSLHALGHPRCDGAFLHGRASRGRAEE